MNDSFRSSHNAVSPSTNAHITYSLNGNYTQVDKISRCKQCLGYFSPYCRVLPPAEQWKCALCGKINEFEKIDQSGELSPYNGSSFRDFTDTDNVHLNELHSQLPLMVETDAITVQKKEHHFVFLIEIGNNSVSRGIPRVVLYEILNLVNLKLDEEKSHANQDEIKQLNRNKKFAFVFYNRNTTILTKSGLLTVKDPENIPIFDYDEHFYSLNEIQNLQNQNNILNPDDLNESIPESCTNPEIFRDPENTFYSTLDFLESTSSFQTDFLGALGVCEKILKGEGGLICCFIGDIPNYGVGNLLLDSKEGKTDDLKVKSPNYKEYAEKLSKAHISVNYYLMPQKSIELQTLSIISRITGGSITYLTNLVAEPEEENEILAPVSLLNKSLSIAIRNSLTSLFNTDNLMFNALLKIRSNRKLDFSSFFGRFHLRSDNILSFCATDKRNSVSFGFSFNDDDKRGEVAREKVTELNEKLVSEVEKFNNTFSNEQFLSDNGENNWANEELYRDSDLKSHLKDTQNQFLSSFRSHLVLQVSLIYTNELGYRKLRVNNLILPILISSNTSFSLINPLGYTHLVMSECYNKIINGEKGEDSVKHFINERFSSDNKSSAHAWPDSRYGQTHSNNHQNQTDDKLNIYYQLLLNLLSLKKCPIIRSQVTTDYKSYYLQLSLCQSVGLVDKIIKPQLFLLSETENGDQSENADELSQSFGKSLSLTNLQNKETVLRPLPLTKQDLSIEDVYFLDCGINCFIFVGIECEKYSNFIQTFCKEHLQHFSGQINPNVVQSGDFNKDEIVLLEKLILLINSRHSNTHTNFYLINDHDFHNSDSQHDSDTMSSLRSLFFSYFYVDEQFGEPFEESVRKLQSKKQ